MASALTHAFAAVALTKILSRRKRNWRFWTLAVASSILPDADVVGFAFGIEYGALLGHRGLSHSLLFAALWSLLVVSSEYRGLMKFSRHWWSLVSLFFLVTVSHGLLDAMTNGGLGVAFFSPFDTARYFFPWRPISVSPVGVGRFFSGQGAAILASEIEYVWLPLATLWVGVVVFRRCFARKSGAGSVSPKSHDGLPNHIMNNTTLQSLRRHENLLLCLFFAAGAIETSIAAFSHRQFSDRMLFITGFVGSVLITYGVMRDSARRGMQRPFMFGLLLLFLWQILGS